MQINTGSNGARVISSGKNVGVFKAVGWPEDVANFYRIEDYEGYIWLAHNRYATKDPGKWERPDPFNLHDWSVAEDGKITSYGTNRRYIESFGYACSMSTDSEIITYNDILVRRHGLDINLAIRALARHSGRTSTGLKPGRRSESRLRLAYGSAMMNGQFTVVMANPDMMVGFRPEQTPTDGCR